MGYNYFEPRIYSILCLTGTIIMTLILLAYVWFPLSFLSGMMRYLIIFLSILSIIFIYVSFDNKPCKNYCGKPYCIDSCDTDACRNACPEDANYCLEGCGKDLRMAMVVFSTILFILILMVIIFSQFEDDLNGKFILTGVSLISLTPLYMVSVNAMGFMCKCVPITKTDSGSVNVSDCNSLSQCSCIT